MNPPEAPTDHIVDHSGDMPPAVSVCLKVIKNRSDFLRAARARRQGTASMMVQARNRSDDDPTIRMGFTCSKKVGNAVARNRAKRRLREVARMVLPAQGLAGWDYVLIGRKDATADRPFNLLTGDFILALKKLHAGA